MRRPDRGPAVADTRRVHVFRYTADGTPKDLNYTAQRVVTKTFADGHAKIELDGGYVFVRSYEEIEVDVEAGRG
jgi:hypothetical protein